MILIFDTCYRCNNIAKTACIKFDSFETNVIEETYFSLMEVTEPYVSGEFYKRELPCIMKLIEQIDLNGVECIIVDGYVNHNEKEVLGAKLYHEFDDRIPIIGIAKNKFIGENQSIEVHRGHSSKPLYVTSIGMPKYDAAKQVKKMYGEYRIPYMVKKVDSFSRE